MTTSLIFAEIIVENVPFKSTDRRCRIDGASSILGLSHIPSAVRHRPRPPFPPYIRTLNVTNSNNDVSRKSSFSATVVFIAPIHLSGVHSGNFEMLILHSHVM